LKLKNGAVDPTFKVLNINGTDADRRESMVSVIGPLLSTPSGKAVRPRADRNDPKSSVIGAGIRFGNLVTSNTQRMREFGKFVDEFLERNFVPLSSEVDLELDTWLETTHYTNARKVQIREAWSSIVNDSDVYAINDIAKVNAFIKEEGYDEYKHSRVINSRSDEWKALVGPICKAIEAEVFKLPNFIKKIPVLERPEYVMQMMALEGKLFTSDFTSYEGSFKAELMAACEMKLFKFFLRNLPGKYYEWLSRVMGVNTIRNRRWRIHVLAKRMSGEMTTSLGNGFTTLTLVLFICGRKGAHCIPVVEGDDCLCKVVGEVPTKEDFAELGLNCKMESHEDLSTTSFCGLLFDDTAGDVVVNPLKVLAECGLGQTRYCGAGTKLKKALLRSKGLSILSQYPNCPILRVLADKILELTSGVNVRQSVIDAMPTWKREEYLQNLKTRKDVGPADIKMGSRVLVERVFGISVNDQLLIEATLHVDFNTVYSPYLSKYVPDGWTEYANTYCVAGKGRGPHEFTMSNTTFNVSGLELPRAQLDA
jgi:hypothetical protein